jgi:methylase of polypeptide subunit release factors
MNVNIENSSFNELKKHYDKVLNTDKSTYKSSNDEPTPIDCICEMITKIPDELWKRDDLHILDPCCGNGNFSIPIMFELMKYHDKKEILEEILEFNDINKDRLENVRKIFSNDKYKLHVTENDFMIHNNRSKYDLIVANPPYAKLLENGKRASKNHNLIKDFIEKALSHQTQAYKEILHALKPLLKPNTVIIFEIGFDQAKKISKLMKEVNIMNIKVFKDYSNKDRFIMGSKKI